MSGIILQGKALRIVNKGGGQKCKTTNLGGGMRRMEFGPRTKGTDYIVFKCPGCGGRNKRSAYEVKGKSGESISFKCNKCLREIEVAPPTESKIILDPNSPALKSGLVGSDGKPIYRE
jgi:hypothetical protein